MLPRFLKRLIQRFLGWGQVSTQQLADADTLCDKLANQKAESSAQRKERLNGARTLLNSETRSAFSFQELTAFFREKRAPAAPLLVHTEIKQIAQAIKVLNHALENELDRLQNELNEGIKNADRQHRTDVATADLNFKLATASLLAIEQQVRREAENQHTKLVNASKAKMDSEISALNNRHEQSVRTATDAAKNKTEMLSARITELKLELARSKFDDCYERIQTDLLDLRKSAPDSQAGLPLLALFTLEQNRCIMQCTIHKASQTNAPTYSYQFSPPLFGQALGNVMEPLKAVVDRLVNSRHTYYNYYYDCFELAASGIAEFTGVIPQAVRTRLKKAAKSFDKVYIVTEAPAWQLRQSDEGCPVPPGSKLVLGEKCGALWLVTIFDTSSAEEYAQRELGRQA